MEGAFYHNMCLLLLRSPEMSPEIVWEEQFPRDSFLTVGAAEPVARTLSWN
jgi:hypothetical protein